MTLTEIFTDVANAIRTKNNSTDKFQPINFAQEIENISSGGSLNVFMQEAEPEIKEGIWVQSNKTFEKVVLDEKIWLGGEWKNEYESIPFDFYDGGIATIGTNVYLFGGTKAPKNAYKYDALTNTYTQLTSTPISFNCCNAVAIGTDIYLFYNTNAYKYNTLTDTYTKLTNIPYGVNGSVGAVAIGTDIYLFIEMSNYKYDTLTDTYTTLANRSYQFYRGATAVIGTDIYLFGGTGSNASQYTYKYDTVANKFTKLTNIPVALYDEGAVVIGTDIYLFYGTNAYKYDTLTDTYTNLTSIPTSFTQGTAVLINGNKIFLFSRTVVQCYELISKTYEYNSIVICQSNPAKYSTQLFMFEQLDVRALYGFFDVLYYTTENGLVSTLPTYYGNGTEWVKFKN